MRYRLPKILLFLFIPVFSYSQKKCDGVYFEYKEKHCLYNKVRLLNTETLVCISDKPIITVDDFNRVSKLEVDTQNSIRTFSIILSAEGSKKLTAISKVYSGKNLAFVVNNEVICLMKVNGVITSGKIIVTEDSSLSSLKYVHKRINESIGL